MTFHVYPDPQTAALTVAPGATTFTSFDQLTGPSVPAGAYNKMMFIRVAVTGGTIAPTLSVKAGTGTAVAAGPTTTGVFRSVGNIGYVGDVLLVTAGEAAHVFQIRMGFDQDTAETWQLGITNGDAVAQDFTWVVAETIAETAQPWVVVSPATLPYHALVNQVINQSVQVANKGTGPLNITSVTPALPATLSVATPLTVAPAAMQSLVFTLTAGAAPPAGGANNATVDLVAQPPDSVAGTSAGHNQRVAITTTTQKLEVVLLLDDSGSMGWDALGNPLPVGATNSRWAELVSATNQFLDLLAHFGKDRGRFGIARFPAGNPANPSTFDIVPMGPIPDVAGMGPAQTAVAAIVPTNGTPMGDGLDRVLAPATSYYGPDAFNRRWLILMSDGAHNAGTRNPLEFVGGPDGTAPVGTSLAERNVDLFAVAYGIEGHSDVNHVLMKQLATGSAEGGQIRNVDEVGTTAATLALALRDAIKAGLTAAVSPLDPSGVFVFGQAAQQHDVALTRFDTTAAFMLSWNTSDASRLRLELITPLCEVITPENAGRGRFAGVTFRATDRSHMYLIDPKFLEPPPNGDGSRGRQGTWTFVITSGLIIGDSPETAENAAVDLERYVYDVMVDSTLRLALSQSRPTYFAGDPIVISARLTGDGRPITGAAVTLQTTLPAGSAANFLAALDVPADALARAKEQLAGKDATPILVKQLGARIAGFVFDQGSRTVTIPMTDPNGIGEYRARFADTSVPEHYTFYVVANGVTDDGVAFRREGKLETFVLVRPDPAHTVLDVRQLKPGLAAVTVIPRDKFGNVLLIDPTTPGGFGIVAKEADVGALTSNLDGTYGATVKFDPGKTPSIGVQFGGRPVVKPTPIPVLADLCYVDKVVKFELGQIQKANRHADPKAALGTVVDKPTDRFVSLGAAGVLTVALKGQVIEACGDDDITVFIAPDSDPRSYRVEAHVAKDDKWALLGTSIGVTQSFGLGAAKLKETDYVRITDTSGRTRDAQLKPLTTPGVSMRGVGAKQVDKRHDDQ